MKKIIFPKYSEDEILFEDAVRKGTPIFIRLKDTGKIIGMFCSIYEDYRNLENSIWIASLGIGGLVGAHKTLKYCMDAVGTLNYDFVIEI